MLHVVYLVVLPVVLHSGILKIHGMRQLRTNFTLSQVGTGAAQKLTTAKVLPYPSSYLFHIIANVDSYSSFIPFCTESKVTQHANGLPTLANLRIGFKLFDECFQSRLMCKPNDQIVADASGTEIFEVLRVVWNLKSQNCDSSLVSLNILYKFKSPIYATLMETVSSNVAPLMVSAFEHRAQKLCKTQQLR